MSDSETNKSKKEPVKPADAESLIQIHPAPDIKPLPGTEVSRDLAKAVKKKGEK